MELGDIFMAVKIDIVFMENMAKSDLERRLGGRGAYSFTAVFMDEKSVLLQHPLQFHLDLDS